MAVPSPCGRKSERESRTAEPVVFLLRLRSLMFLPVPGPLFSLVSLRRFPYTFTPNVNAVLSVLFRHGHRFLLARHDYEPCRSASSTQQCSGRREKRVDSSSKTNGTQQIFLWPLSVNGLIVYWLWSIYSTWATSRKWKQWKRLRVAKERGGGRGSIACCASKQCSRQAAQPLPLLWKGYLDEEYILLHKYVASFPKCNYFRFLYVCVFFFFYIRYPGRRCSWGRHPFVLLRSLVCTLCSLNEGYYNVALNQTENTVRVVFDNMDGWMGGWVGGCFWTPSEMKWTKGPPACCNAVSHNAPKLHLQVVIYLLWDQTRHTTSSISFISLW